MMRPCTATGGQRAHSRGPGLPLACFTSPRFQTLLLAAAISLTARPTVAQTSDMAPLHAQQGVQNGVQTGVQSPAASGMQTGPASPQQTPGTDPSLVPGARPSPYSVQDLIRTPTLSPGALTLIELDTRFSQAVEQGGGKAFAEWFAEDGVTLNNGRPAVQGRSNIALAATWNAKDYQLTWIPQGAQMGPSNDMGFTWGSYQGRSKDKNGQPVVTAGRYITVWRKQADGNWKVAMDASADDAPSAAACCTLPKP